MKNEMTKILKEISKEKDEEKRFAIIYKLVILKESNEKEFKKEFIKDDKDVNIEMLKEILHKFVIGNPKWEKFKEKNEK